MKTNRSVLSGLVLLGTIGLGSPVMSQEGLLVKEVAIEEANYCHMQFAAITEESLRTNRPVLGVAGEVDVIDFYGPCNYDPKGKEEVADQRHDRHLWHGDENDS